MARAWRQRSRDWRTWDKCYAPLHDTAAPATIRWTAAPAFDRTPDTSGLGFWIGALDQGATLLDVAARFVASQEFIDLYGAAPTNAELVTHLYQNILHRAPERAGYDYWLNILDSKLADAAQVLAEFSESAENQDGTAALIAHGIVFTPYGG